MLAHRPTPTQTFINLIAMTVKDLPLVDSLGCLSLLCRLPHHLVLGFQPSHGVRHIS